MHMYTDINFAMTHCSRKRPRSCEDEGCELMPISKRINDLHIRSCFPESSSLADGIAEMQPRVRNAKEAADVNYVCMAELHRQQIATKDSGIHCSYRPELSVTENPYYYHVNELLYEAHIQRLQRLAKAVA